MTGHGQPANDLAAADLWRRTLEQVPSAYGRLVYLASLRNPNTNRYEHHGFAARFGEEQAERVLRSNHEEIFQDWLALGVREKKDDLDTYLSSIDDNKRLVVETWLKIMPFRNLQPGAARGVEADLFLADFRVLLELLRSEYGAAEPDRGA
jgi:hypothetical protein